MAKPKSKHPSFADWFQAMRKDKAQTQVEAAAELGVDGSAVCRWEKGGAPRAEHLEQLRVWSGIKADKLLKIVSAAS
jgi:transcriptional regulator with XRE-family HTH domain